MSHPYVATLIGLQHHHQSTLAATESATAKPPPLRVVPERKGDGHGVLEELMDCGHGHAQRTFEKTLETFQLDLSIADAVFPCGDMMANKNCVVRDRENGSTDLGHRGLMKDFMRM